MQDDKQLPEDLDALDPAGPPVPVVESQPKSQRPAGPMTGLLTVIAGSGALLSMCALTTTQTCGATRSAQIEWERRQAEIERAIAEEEPAAEIARHEEPSAVADRKADGGGGLGD